MKRYFAVDYDDGKVRAKAGAAVPASIPDHKQGVLLRAGVIKDGKHAKPRPAHHGNPEESGEIAPVEADGQ